MRGAAEANPTEPRERYDRLVRAAQQLPPVPTAVAHPCDRISIEGAAEAAQLGLIAPILVGPSARIRDAAKQAEADISRFPIEESAHSHDSAAKAVELVRSPWARACAPSRLPRRPAPPRLPALADCHRRCGTGIAPDRDITAFRPDIPAPACLCRPRPLVPARTTAENRGFSDLERRIPVRDRFAPDSPLEGDGFEP